MTTNFPTTSQRLHEALGLLISSKKPGERLPSEPDLARQLGVSRATLREAMRTFETQGMIHRRQGSGTYVSRPSQVIESGLEILESIDTLAKRVGLSVALGDLKVESRPATESESEILRIPLNSQVTSIRRVILAEGHPAAYLVDVVPENVIQADELDANFRGSVLDLLLMRQNPPLSSSRCEINAVTASVEIARAMGIQRGDVLLCFEAYLYSSNGKVVDISLSYFLPGYFKFYVVRRVG